MCSAGQYDDPSQPILAAYDGSQSDLVLRLPRGVTVRWAGEEWWLVLIRCRHVQGPEVAVCLVQEVPGKLWRDQVQGGPVIMISEDCGI